MTPTRLPQEAFRIVEEPRVCSYLPQQTAALEFRLFPRLTGEQLEHLIARGWRRFGVHVFRPRCAACERCIPVRVDVAGFQPSKSQRRTLKRNSHVRVVLAEPEATPEHVQLYNAWHSDMTERRQWPLQQIDAAEYRLNFLLGDFSGMRELRYFIDGELAGVGLVDLLPHSLSSMYFYHGPGWRSLGPGTYSLLQEIQLAAELGLSHVYLGYWIADCASMAYKNRFRPCETLRGRPDDDDDPCWSTWHPGEDL